ncbi:TonB-dependent siderophore receptor [Ensifer adhaerens]|uniref:TonB-dependent siderophore receptor n=1 Tax=Ensifer adhaerens TaxID=106592 RepID=UPI001CBD6197|nr:TonB-dependent siderophore receptor [Ensifer adhaerens]MBZ7924146.1 TonB-dependent siderophore receptor [Ensifer adhaerens]UAX96592.1 TonB-dependent siderophore receptor [Ensifer adhaerens]UAY04064.1 TonB-dependent siderophore receptor [Ensifer adhaerens]UAY12050.1 TonB-dependent siderophore receptor [Ensifer adhaerens]
MLTFGGYYNSERNPGADWNGLPARPDGSFYDFDRSVRSSPSWTYWDKENFNVFGEVKHEFENDWELNVKGSYLDTKLDMLGASLYRLDPSADELQYNVGKYFYHHKQTALDANLKGDFVAFGRTHEFSVGANYRKNRSDDGPGGWPASFPYRFDPLNWQNSIDAPYPEFNYLWSLQSEIVNFGVYGTTKINIADPLNIFLGGRLSWNDTETHYRSGTYEEATAFNAKGKFTPYIAATFDITDNLTVYGSITDIFKPQNYQTAGGGLIDPVEGTNYEVGLKGEFMDGRLNASVAVFQIDQTNLPQQVVGSCGGLDCYTAAGEVRSRGLEVEVSGEITDGWNVFAGYTYVDSRYVEGSSSGAAGSRYGRDLPQNTLTLSTIYTLSGEWENWRIGASARAQSKIEGDVAGVTTTKQGGFGTVDLMAAYNPNEKTEFRLNVYNVFDKYYYKSVGYTDNANILGAPRSFMLTGTYKF